MKVNRLPLIGPGGAPTIGRVPTRLVTSGPLNAAQSAALTGMYDAFYTDCQLSIARSRVADKTLPDGSRVRMFSNQGLDTVLVWPVQSDEAPPDWWVAYPAFVDLTYCPVFDREVIDLGGSMGPLPPDEPKFKELAPLPIYVAYSLSIMIEGQITQTETHRNISVTTSVVRMLGGNVEQLFSVDGSVASDLRIGTETALTVLRNSPSPGLLTENSASDPDYVPGKIGPKFRPWGASGAPGVRPGEGCSSYAETEDGSYGPVLISGTHPTYANDDLYWPPAPTLDGQARPTGTPDFSLWNFMLVHNAAMSAAQAAADAEYAALEAAWRSRYNTWLNTTYQRWLDATRGRDGNPTRQKYTPITARRVAGRKKQIEALHKFLDEGPNHPHLAARHLSFPFDIVTRPAAPLSLPDGEIEITGPFSLHPGWGKYLKYELKKASSSTEVPDYVADPAVSVIDKGGFLSVPPHPLGRALAMPSCLYGWQASGTLERKAEYRYWHDQEAAQMAKVEDVKFSVASEYSGFLQAGVVSARTSPEQAVICSDGYVPPGTMITKVRLEYECWDPFTSTWIWTPLTSLTQVDAVWIVSLSSLADVDKVDMPQPVGAVSPRAVRIRGAQQQKRLKNMLWSAPSPVPCKQWSMKALEPHPALQAAFPADIVIAERLAPTARPSGASSNNYPFGAYSTSSTDVTLRGRIAAEPAPFINLDTLLVQAVRATGKPIAP